MPKTRLKLRIAESMDRARFNFSLRHGCTRQCRAPTAKKADIEMKTTGNSVCEGLAEAMTMLESVLNSGQEAFKY